MDVGDRFLPDASVIKKHVFRVPVYDRCRPCTHRPDVVIYPRIT